MKVAVDPVSVAYTDLASEAKIRVLHVDNDAPFLAVATHRLEEQGPFQVDAALSAKEALEKLRHADYDVVVADYQMPGKNGLELLKELRQEGIAVPFILFTCKGKEEVAIEALNSGVEQYIDKQGNAAATYEELKHSILSAVKRRRTEKLLKESESRLRQITENMQDLLLLTDKNSIVTYVSSSYIRVSGYEPNEIIGKCVYDFVHPDDLAMTMQTADKAFKDNSGGKVEARVRRADGSYTLLEFVGKELTDENGQITGVVMSSRDITERKKAEEALKRYSEYLENIFAASPNAITVSDSNGNVVDCNQATLDMLGFSSKEELIGKNGFSLIARKDLQKAAEHLKEAIEQGSVKNVEYTFLTKDGCEVPAEVSASAIRDSSGNPTGFVSITRNIAERKKENRADTEGVRRKIQKTV